MSRLTAGIAGAIALSLMSGAAQFALGRDLSSAKTSLVNRSTKTDQIRTDGTLASAGAVAPMRTIALKLEGFLDTTFLLRVPAADGNAPATPPKPVARRPMVACEPVVSVLTEVAKLIAPGRCVT